MDFRPGKGGIARVSNLINNSTKFDKIFSLHGNGHSENSISYFNNNRKRFMLDVFSYVIRKRPSLVVCDHVGIASILAFMPKILTTKVVTFLHDEEAWKCVTGRHKLGLLRSDLLLCNSNYTFKRFIENNSAFANKTQVCLLAGVPEAFKANITDMDNAEWINSERPFCIFVSRLWKEHRYKGHFELIKAFKKYYEKNNKLGLRLAIIGNGDDEGAVKSYIKELDLEGSVHVFTKVSDNELINFYSRSIALFFPSIREGFGLVFLEAMFFKKACIGIANQPAEEIISDYETGRLLSDNDPETLYKMLLEIDEEPEKIKNYGLNGYKRYQEKFTTAHFKNRFLELIQNT